MIHDMKTLRGTMLTDAISLEKDPQNASYTCCEAFVSLSISISSRMGTFQFAVVEELQKSRPSCIFC